MNDKWISVKEQMPVSTIDTDALFYGNNHIVDDECGNWTKTPENAGGEKQEENKEKL